MRGKKAALALSLATGLVLSACSNGEDITGSQLSPGARLISALQPFDECDGLLGYFKQEATKRVGPNGLPQIGNSWGPMPLASRTASDAVAAGAPAEAGGRVSQVAGADYSDTNVQEEGVDEADIAKTNGNLLVTIGSGRLNIVDTSAEVPVQLSSFVLPNNMGGSQLFLNGSRVFILSYDYGPPIGTKVGSSAPENNPSFNTMPVESQRAVISEIDISDPSNPKIVASLSVEGTHISSRSVNGTARIVVRSSPTGVGFVSPHDLNGAEAALEANREAVAASNLRNWMPYYRLTDQRSGDKTTKEGQLVECNQVSRPNEFSGFDMLSVLTIDFGKPLALGDVTSVLAGGENLYASKDRLYVTTNRYDLSDASAASKTSDKTTAPSLTTSSATTEIHAFSIAGTEPARYLASGRVKGRLHNQFSMSEHNGNLRVATTIDPVFAVEPSGGPVQSNQPVSQSESFVTVLALEDGRLNKIGELAGLGKTEQIYSVRFIGDRGYVVTFRQTDPLYVIDLSDPKNPTVSGELKIPGFSSYLHPVGENLLLGVGQDATEEGRVQGSQISLFDVSDPKNPTRTSQLSLGGGSSEIQYDHHAFLFWPKTGLAVIPHQSFGPEGLFIGAVAATVQPGTGLIELGRTSQPAGGPNAWPNNIRRSMVIGNSLYTISEVGVEALDPNTLASKTWVAFPIPEPVITDPYAEGKAPTG